MRSVGYFFARPVRCVQRWTTLSSSDHLGDQSREPTGSDILARTGFWHGSFFSAILHRHRTDNTAEFLRQASQHCRARCIQYYRVGQKVGPKNSPEDSWAEFVVKWMLKIPPHLAYVATRPCETWTTVITWRMFTATGARFRRRLVTWHKSGHVIGPSPSSLHHPV